MIRAKRAAGAPAVALGMCVILCGLSTGCGKPAGLGANPVTAVAAVGVETAERREVPATMELPARIEAVVTVEIRANVEGQLTGMAFQEGRLARKGQLLFRIDPRRYAAAVESAAANVEKAEADLEMAREQQHLVNAQAALRQAEAGLLKANQDAERMKPLAARRAVPQRDMDAAVAAQSSAVAAVEDARATVRTTTVGDRNGIRQAQASLSAARAALERAEMDREETAIRAPMDGLIGRSEVSVGNYVGRGEPSRLATISQVDPINAVFSIPEALYLRTSTKGVDRAALNRIALVLPDNTTYPLLGRFASLGRTVDEKTGTLMVVAQFPNPKGTLLPGMSGRVRIAGQTRPDAVLVPERAMFDTPGGKAVYVVTADHRVALCNVVTEGSYERRVIVTKGLGGGEAVIVEGITQVKPGQVVAPQAAR
jgi:membrane fusion protein (multidrug efflux system)